MNNAYYTIIGMDVGDRKTQVCVMARAAGTPKVVLETAIPTTREGLAKFLATQDRASAVAFEAGTHCRWMDEVARGMGFKVYVANPCRLRMITESKTKNDVNDARALDAPGEWYLDGMSGMLYVYPKILLGGGKRRGPRRYELSLAAHSLVVVKGASHVRFEGIVFRGGRHHGMELCRVSDVVLEGCVFRDLGGHGLLCRNMHDSLVRGCVFHTFGHCAMTLDGGDRKTLAPSGVTVEACDFGDTGLAMRTYTPGIWVTGCGHRIVRSYFHDFPSSAMRVGGNEHLIASNVLERAVLESDDQGAVDMWGDPTYRGNKFIHNVFRDIGRGGAFVKCGQGGIRLDDAISGNLVYGNRFIDCSKGHFGGVQIHGGRDNVVRNNVFTRCAHGITVTPWTLDKWREFNTGEKHEARCRAANVDGAAFRAKYPDFGALLDTPMRNTFERNVFEGDGKPPEAGFEPLPPESAIGLGADAVLEKARARDLAVSGQCSTPNSSTPSLLCPRLAVSTCAHVKGNRAPIASWAFAEATAR